MFDTFLEELNQGFSVELPGQNAQFKMVPQGRERTNLENIEHRNPKRAAVLVLFYPVNSTPHIVLMKRNSYPGVHSDQISFPGGKFEVGDENLKQTALREANEELGIISANVEIVGELTQVYIPPSNFLVNPYVGYAKEKPSFIPELKEVTEIVEADFSSIRNLSNVENVAVNVRGFKMDVPAFMINGHVVWGATAMMLSELAHVLGPTDRV
ncbi:MAG: CoA pyrophosphatase [Schleiferiaceae bacterium]|jgi:8-oxo-dGTP pyrophosphatase MutT (NUDIX family)|nr:CoA pyrophosphatase [Schleiferiaceae bacterium]